MSETGFMLFQHIVGGTETVLYAACMTFLFYPFMSGRKERRKNILKKAAIVFVAYVLVYLICGATAVPGWLCMIIVIALLTSSHRILGMENNHAFVHQPQAAERTAGITRKGTVLQDETRDEKPPDEYKGAGRMRQL